MGWGSAGSIFETVADALIEADAEPEVITAACVKLIRELEAGDWDTQGESMETYQRMAMSEQVAAVLEAFRLTENVDEDSWCTHTRIMTSDGHGLLRVMCSKMLNHDGKHFAYGSQW